MERVKNVRLTIERHRSGFPSFGATPHLENSSKIFQKPFLLFRKSALLTPINSKYVIRTKLIYRALALFRKVSSCNVSYFEVAAASLLLPRATSIFISISHFLIFHFEFRFPFIRLRRNSFTERKVWLSLSQSLIHSFTHTFTHALLNLASFYRNPAEIKFCLE